MFCTRFWMPPKTRGNYLSIATDVLCYNLGPAFVFLRSKCPYQIWVSHSRGLPVPLRWFPIGIVTVALLKRRKPYCRQLRSVLSRQRLSVALAYFFARRGHYNRHRLCEHGLSSTFNGDHVCVHRKLQLPEYHLSIIANF